MVLSRRCLVFFGNEVDYQTDSPPLASAHPIPAIRRTPVADSRTSLPQWDLTTIYPSLVSPEFRGACDTFAQDVARLETLFEAHEVNRRKSEPLDDETIAAFENVITRFNAVQLTSWQLQDYITAFIDTDAQDMLARTTASELRPFLTRVAELRQRLVMWVGLLDVDELISRSVVARDHAFPLRRVQQRANYTMSETEEALAAAMHVSGGAAWTQLHADLTTAMTARIRQDDAECAVPMSEIRARGIDRNREVRQQAYEAEVTAWEAIATPLTAALNGIKGEVTTLTERRGWASPLDAALFDLGIDVETVQALVAATREALPDFQRYLRAKARLLGIPALAWYDLAAPVGAADEWTFDSAAALITERFRAYGPALGDLAEQAFREQWIDAEPRPGKRGGGLCLWVGEGISRIRLEFRPHYDSVRTLSHELGHAYHAAVLAQAGRTALQIDAAPPTLMETSSKFCEELVRRGALHRAEARGREEEQLALLDAFLGSTRRSVVDVLAMFLFEDRFFARRRTRELGVDEINALMLEAQRETTGDVIDPTTPYPWSWAALPHLYLDGVSFYNLPYLFGLLFALGLHARYVDDPKAFIPAFDDLLASTGMADPASLASRFDIDLRSRDFWRAGLDSIRADIQRFEILVAQNTGRDPSKDNSAR